ncbi:transmembrane protein 150C [Etheostoma cragini]|uniref:transmembrane protein 150C n=1 Tax=Etheostoma cragini TaxID=417921 RepID=UPI00155ED641|nr:transmembrane protein 150C [Etheostoma cragini]
MWRSSPWALLPPVYAGLTAAGLWLVYFVAVNDEKISPLGSTYSGARYLEVSNKRHPKAADGETHQTTDIQPLMVCPVFQLKVFTEEMIHNFGTLMTFGLGTLYCWVQSYITLRVDLKKEGRKAGIIRFLLSGSITVCMILYFSLMGQRLHMQAAQCQWALVMFFITFLGTFAIEFRHNRFGIVCTDSCGRPARRSEALSEASRYQPGPGSATL